MSVKTPIPKQRTPVPDQGKKPLSKRKSADSAPVGEVIESQNPLHQATANMVATINGTPPDSETGDSSELSGTTGFSGRDSRIVFLSNDVTGLDNGSRGSVTIGEGEKIVGLEKFEKGIDENQADSETPEANASNEGLTEAEAAQMRAKSKQDAKSMMRGEVDEGTQDSPAKAVVEEGKPAVLTTEEKPIRPKAPTPEVKPVEIASTAEKLGDTLEDLEEKVVEPAVEEPAEPMIAVVAPVAIEEVPAAEGEEETEEEEEETPGEERDITLEEAKAELASGRSREDSLAAIEELKAEFVAKSEEDKISLRTEAETRKQSIDEQVQAGRERIAAIVDARVSAIRGSYGSARKALADHVTAKKKELDAHLKGDIAEVNKINTEGIGKFEGELGDIRKQFSKFISTAKAEPMKIAVKEGRRSDGEIDKAKEEASRKEKLAHQSFTPVEDKKDRQMEAASRVAEAARKEMEEKKPGIKEELIAKTEGYGDNFDQYNEAVAAQTGELELALKPEFAILAEETINSLKEIHKSVIKTIDDNHQADIKRLNAGEARDVAQVRKGGDDAIAGIENYGDQSKTRIDEITSTVVSTIDTTTQETVAYIDGQPEPYLPGVVERLDFVRTALAESRGKATESMQETMDGLPPEIEKVVLQLDEKTAQVAESAANNAQTIRSSAIAQLDKLATATGEKLKTVVEGLKTSQKAIIQTVRDEMNPIITQLKEEVNGTNEQFRQDAVKGVDEGLVEARKPMTDDLWTRMKEAWDKAGEPWWKGALRALGSILVGLLVVLVLAVILVVMVAVIFGTVMTLWTAMLIVGAIFLIVAIGAAYTKRSNQVDENGNPVKAPLFWAVLDGFGVTGIYEGIMDKDIATGEELNLSDADRTEKGVEGVFTLAMLILGTRAAIKGPRGIGKPAGLQLGMNWWQVRSLAAVEALSGVKGALTLSLKSMGEMGRSIWRFMRDPRPALKSAGQGIRGRATSLYEFIKSPRKGVAEWFESWKSGDGPLRSFLRDPAEGAKSVRETFNEKFANVKESVSKQIESLKTQIRELTESLKKTKEEGKGSGEEGKGTEEKGKGTEEEVKGTEEEVKGTEEEVKGTEEEVKGTEEEGKGTEEEVKGTEEEFKGTEEEIKGPEEEGKGAEEEAKEAEEEVKEAEEEAKDAEEEQKGEEEVVEEDPPIADWDVLEASIRQKLDGKIEPKILNKLINSLKNGGNEGLSVANKIHYERFAEIEGYIDLIKKASTSPGTVKAVDQALSKANEYLKAGRDPATMRFEHDLQTGRHDVDFGIKNPDGTYEVAYQFKTLEGKLTARKIQDASVQLKEVAANQKIVEIKAPETEPGEINDPRIIKEMKYQRDQNGITEYQYIFKDGSRVTVKTSDL